MEGGKVEGKGRREGENEEKGREGDENGGRTLPNLAIAMFELEGDDGRVQPAAWGAKIGSMPVPMDGKEL